MKKQYIILWLVGLFMTISTSLWAQEKHAAWLYNYEQAMNKAKSENKNLLLSFSGSDWCLPCMKMEKKYLIAKAFRNIPQKIMSF